MSEDLNKINALIQHMGLDTSELDEDVLEDEYELMAALDIEEEGDDLWKVEGETYLILDDDEADDKWEEALDDYVEQVILPELPNHYQNYFDDEKWKDEARYDGRGRPLSPYDGNEYEESVDGTNYFLYRQN